MSESAVLKVTLIQAKETRNTVRYDADPSDDKAAVDSVYLKKFALDGNRPQKIEVEIHLQ